MISKAYVKRMGNKIVLYCFVNEVESVIHCFHVNTSHINIRKWAERWNYDVMNMRDLRY